MPVPAGSTLGPYEIASLLGAGGMGEVYRAVDTRLGRSVAIKVLPAHLSQDASRQRRLLLEARTVSALQHPHICTLFDVGSQDGTHYLVMEYLEGESLAARLARGPLPSDDALQTAIDIAEALREAHRLGFIHRDLKPGNIMLTKTGAKLMDFGLAKLREADRKDSETLSIDLARQAAASAYASPFSFGHTHHTHYQVASIYAVLGDTQSAMHWLERAVETGFPCWPFFCTTGVSTTYEVNLSSPI